MGLGRWSCGRPDVAVRYRVLCRALKLKLSGQTDGGYGGMVPSRLEDLLPGVIVQGAVATESAGPDGTVCHHRGPPHLLQELQRRRPALDDLTVVVDRNGSGKSNALDGL